jgi:hypothetical protein
MRKLQVEYLAGLGPVVEKNAGRVAGPVLLGRAQVTCPVRAG